MRRRGAGAPHTLVAAVVLASALVAGGCVQGKPKPDQPPVLRGLADFHSHQFGHLGWGVLSHDVDPTTQCRPIPVHDSSTFRMVDLVRDGLFAEATKQAKNGQCYPTHSNLASQRTDTENLKRAWQYGLRLFVVHAVNSEFLCRIADLPCTTDREHILMQFNAAKNLQAKIDTESGGDGEGWYRIVTTPAEAREVILQGKLAVVLGVETSNAFGCTFVSSGTVEGVPNLLGITGQETTYRLDCGNEDLRTQRALALFETYWRAGARHFFPIHNMDGTAGGTSLSIPLLHAEVNPSGLASGGGLNKVPDIDRVIRAVRPPFQSWNCSSGGIAFDKTPPANPADPDVGRCNSAGLTPTGRALIRLMASYGAVIDIDHMSLKSKREVLGNEGLLGGVYPFMSSHGGVFDLNSGEARNEGQLRVEDLDLMIRAGGAIAPILPPGATATYPAEATVAPNTCRGTSETFVQAYRYVVERLKAGKLFNGDSAFAGVGFGTDFSGPVPVAAAPRFVDSAVPVTGETSFESLFSGGPRSTRGGYCYLTDREFSSDVPPHVTYPFNSPLGGDPSNSPLGGDPFKMSTTPWGGRTTPYDVSFDGVVHIGMIPDFVEELRVLGLSDAELEPLWRGAEAYVRAWESSNAWQGNFSSEKDGVLDACAELRAEFGRTFQTAPANPPPRNRFVILADLKQQGCHGT